MFPEPPLFAILFIKVYTIMVTEVFLSLMVTTSVGCATSQNIHKYKNGSHDDTIIEND